MSEPHWLVISGGSRWYNPQTMEGTGPEQERLFFMAASSSPQTRDCPWCGSRKTKLVQRGYTGPTDEINQYYTCQSCGKVTYELVSKTAREMRLGRFQAGAIYKDLANQTRYQITRVLKVGINEFLIYLKPMPGSDDL
jgi:transposase-like protein